MNVKAFLPLCACFVIGCSSTIGGSGDNGECPYSNPAPNKALRLHGEPCTADTDCAYGLCLHSDAYSANPNDRFCTKQCECGPNSACSDDQSKDTGFFTCQRFTKSKHPTEKFLAICTLTCLNVGDCPPPYDDCSAVQDAAPSKVCRMKSATPQS